jgi:hypothetical protein
MKRRNRAAALEPAIRARGANEMTRTTEQALRQQQQDAERDQRQPPTAKVPAPTTSTAVAPADDDRAARNRYLEDIAGGMPGRLFKFSTKVNEFVTVDDGSDVETNVDYVALCPETLVGWIKFPGNDLPPERVMGLLYDGFQMPARDELGDLDETQWPAGLSNASPQDPGKHQIALPLMNAATEELLVFTTLNDTGRRSVGRLLQHYERMLRLNRDELPLVRLKVGDFNHRDPRVGWVSTPQFAIVGRTKRDAVAKPATRADDLDDCIPF